MEQNSHYLVFPFQIGTMASNFLELPEERLNILLRLCRMMGGAKDKESGVDVSVQFTVAKLAAATLLEIYKVAQNYYCLVLRNLYLSAFEFLFYLSSLRYVVLF